MLDTATAAGVPAAVDRLLDRLECLHDRPANQRRVVELSGGLTNRNFHVTTDRVDVVVRISKKDGGLLAIDRDAEAANSRAAAAAETSPNVVEYRPDDAMLVVEFVQGRTLEPVDVGDDAMIPRLAEAMRRLHTGPRFVNEFDMFEIQRRYLQTVRANGFRLPGRYLDFMPQLDQIQAALAVAPIRTAPCNNDLLPANFIATDDQIWIIDFEYSGNNDPYFELGNTWSEASLEVEKLTYFVECYDGVIRPSHVARARLLGLMSKYGWTLWASIQDATADMDFDFWAWGMEKYDRAVAEFEAAGFEPLLAAAAGPD